MLWGGLTYVIGIQNPTPLHFLGLTGIMRGQCTQLGPSKALGSALASTPSAVLMVTVSGVGYEVVDQVPQEAQCASWRWCEGQVVGSTGTDTELRQFLSIHMLSRNMAPASPTWLFPSQEAGPLPPLLGNFWGFDGQLLCPATCTLYCLLPTSLNPHNYVRFSEKLSCLLHMLL